MFSHYQITHFRTFGFVVLPGLLDADETVGLAGEVTDALTEAFGAIGTDTDPDGTGGIRGDYLPLSVDRTPISQALIADDQRLFQGAADLLAPARSRRASPTTASSAPCCTRAATRAR